MAAKSPDEDAVGRLVYWVSERRKDQEAKRGWRAAALDQRSAISALQIKLAGELKATELPRREQWQKTLKELATLPQLFIAV
jgi:hypothetical protein